MILKGNQRASGRELAAHLLNTKDNEHVEVHELRGFMSQDLKGAFEEIEAVSRGTWCKQYLFSLSLNPPQEENVSIEDFEKAIDKIEHRLGLSGQPRVVVFHEKHGRRHAHCVWSRIDAATMTAINLPHYKLKLHELSRELYLQHGWDMPEGFNDPRRKDPLNYSREEAQQAKRQGDDPKVIKMHFQQCWRMTKTGKAFRDELERHGYYLAKGDKRGVVAVDWRGKVYSLSRWLNVNTKALRARVVDVDLPSVSDVQYCIRQSLAREEQGSTPEIKKDNQTIAAQLVKEREAMIARHKQERQHLHRMQQERHVKEMKTRFDRLPTGMKASFSMATGQYNAILKRNDKEIRQGQTRNREEKQDLIQHQLHERRIQQKQMKIWLGRHWQQTGLSKKDIGAYLTPDTQKDLQTRATVKHYFNRAAQPARTSSSGNPPSLIGIQDTSGMRRAAAAYKHEFDKWQALIDEVARDPHLTKEQRAAKIAGIREQQKREAEAARKRVLEEERQKRVAQRKLYQLKMR